MTSRNFQLLSELSNGNDSIHKLAYSIMDRKSLNKEISKIQKELSKARKEYIQTSSELKGLEVKFNAAKELLNRYTNELIQLSQLSKDLDLSGADNISPQGDEFAFMMNGKRMHVDSSDVNDIKITPWKEHVKSKKNDTNNVQDDEEVSDDDFFDLQTDNDELNFNNTLAFAAENKYITKIAKKFR